MRIDGSNRLNGPARGGPRRQAGNGGDVFQLEEGRAQRAPTVHQGPAAISGVDALIALQSVGDDRPEGARLRHGHDMLDLLESIKIEMLEGRLSTAKIERLVDNLRHRPPRLGEGGIEDILDQIELRARVELAKLGREAA